EPATVLAVAINFRFADFRSPGKRPCQPTSIDYPAVSRASSRTYPSRPVDSVTIVRLNLDIPALILGVYFRSGAPTSRTRSHTFEVKLVVASEARMEVKLEHESRTLSRPQRSHPSGMARRCSLLAKVV